MEGEGEEEEEEEEKVPGGGVGREAVEGKREREDEGRREGVRGSQSKDAGTRLLPCSKPRGGGSRGGQDKARPGKDGKEERTEARRERHREGGRVRLTVG